MVIDEQLATYDYELEILVAGVDTDCAHIYRISNPGTAECLDGLGYHAIGSGEPHADFSFIEESYSQSATVQEARATARRHRLASLHALRQKRLAASQ